MFPIFFNYGLTPFRLSFPSKFGDIAEFFYGSPRRTLSIFFIALLSLFFWLVPVGLAPACSTPYLFPPPLLLLFIPFAFWFIRKRSLPVGFRLFNLSYGLLAPICPESICYSYKLFRLLSGFYWFSRPLKFTLCAKFTLNRLLKLFKP